MSGSNALCDILSKTLRIGYHVSISGTIDLAFDRAREVGCTAMQIFPSNPRGWSAKQLSASEVENFRKKAGFDINPVFVHMPYLPNLASPDKLKYKKSTEALNDAVERCKLLGVKHIITHLGSHMDSGKSAGIERVAHAINSVKDAGDVIVLMENEAGQRNSVGSELEDLAELYDKVEIKTGFCLDTCHAFAAGYNITKISVLDQIASILGLEKIVAIHMNDAKYELGSHRDRHENIGFGHIGIAGFRKFFGYKGMRNKPVILETPRDGKIGAGKELDLAKGIISETVDHREKNK